MKQFLADLEQVSPALRFLVEALLHLLVGLAVWLVASVPLSIAYVALKDFLLRAIAYFSQTTHALHQAARDSLERAAEYRRAAIKNFSVKYVYDINERRLLNQLKLITRETDSIGKDLLSESATLSDRMTLLARELGLVREGWVTATGKFELPALDEVKTASSTRRSSLVTLLVGVPVLIALIVVNTGMLTKFFESFVDEYISYKLGIKLSMVLGLFFTFLEIGLGTILYNVGRHKRGDSISGSLLQVFVVILIAALAFVETYLYLLLSSDVARQMTIDRFVIPGLEGAQFLHAWWLAPFGAVVVFGLALLGHQLVDALNRFVEAGHAKAFREVLDEAKRFSLELDRVWVRVKQLANEALEALTVLEQRVNTSNGDPSSVSKRVAGAVTAITSASQQAIQIRREPFSISSDNEAARLLDMYMLGAITFVVTIIGFCWLQMWLLGQVPAIAILGVPIFVAIAIIEATTVVVASYRMYPPVSMHLDEPGFEPIRTGREIVFSVICIVFIMFVVVFNLLIAIYSQIPFWAVIFVLALVCIGALVLFGRNFPYVAMSLRVILVMFACAIWAAVVGLFALLSLTAFAVAVVLLYALYFLAYPFLALFWRRHLGDPLLRPNQ